jgi:hypothetical protein
MLEQRQLLEEMLAQAEISVKQLGDKMIELEGRQDLTRLEGTVLEVVLRLGSIWLGLILNHWAANLAAEAGTRRQCVCGGVARWVELRTKTILTLLGRVSYQRVYYHCKECHKGEALGDRAWGLAHTRTSRAVKELLAYLVANTVGFITVGKDLCRTMHWPQQWLSGKQVQRLAEPLGKDLGEAEVKRVAKWWRMLTAGLALSVAGVPSPAIAKGEAPKKSRGKAPQRMYVQMDGIMTRIRGAQGKGSDFWREFKVGAVFWAEAGRHASKLAELVGKSEAATAKTVRVWVDRPQGAISYAAGMLTAADFGVRLYAEAVARGLARAKEVVILADGALWIWQLAEEHFPGAIQILDFRHARERVWAVANAIWGEGSAKSKEWAEAAIENHLIRGDVKGLVAAIGGLPKIAPVPGENRSTPERAMEYFQNNAQRMRYPEYRARGLEIGSGVAESSGRRVVGCCCKGPGMRWSEEGVRAVVELRRQVLNNRYDSAIAQLREAA